jgi:hypothetical protein
MEIVNLTEKFSRIHDYWNPRIAGELNDSYVKLVKLKGEFVWHHHAGRTSSSWWSMDVFACSSAMVTATLGRAS